MVDKYGGQHLNEKFFTSHVSRIKFEQCTNDLWVGELVEIGSLNSPPSKVALPPQQINKTNISGAQFYTSAHNKCYMQRDRYIIYNTKWHRNETVSGLMK